jgi:hypothetical protein
MRRAANAVLAAVVVAAIWPRPDMSAQAAGINGAWTIDRPRSEFPLEVGFGASFMPASPVAPDASGGRGRGRAGRTNPVYQRPDSQDDARRIQQLTDAVGTPPINLSIVDTAFANRFWRILGKIEDVFTRGQCPFIGKCSPTHFF